MGAAAVPDLDPHTLSCKHAVGLITNHLLHVWCCSAAAGGPSEVPHSVCGGSLFNFGQAGAAVMESDTFSPAPRGHFKAATTAASTRLRVQFPPTPPNV